MSKNLAKMYLLLFQSLLLDFESFSMNFTNGLIFFAHAGASFLKPLLR
jgi:hypothetical protein